MAPFYLGIESVLILYFIYAGSMPFDLGICATYGAEEHERVFVMFYMAAFVAVNIKGFVHDSNSIDRKVTKFS
jgi:hypothetical protein